MLYEVITEIKSAVLSRALSIFENMLKMVHPFMPFVTEELNVSGDVITSYSIHYTKLYEFLSGFLRMIKCHFIHVLLKIRHDY